MIQQAASRAVLVDEIQLHVAPLLLEGGARPFDGSFPARRARSSGSA